MPYIDDITQKATLLDTIVSNNENENSMLYHTFYAYTEVMGYPALLRLRVEELYYYGDKGSGVLRRDYILQNIEEKSLSESNRLSRPNQSEKNFSINSISDLFNLVKQYDSEFKPNPVNEALIENGKQKVFYHGAKKNGGFTEFRSWQYFTDNKTYAERYAERGNENSLYEVFLTANKIFDTRDEEAKSIFEKIRQEYGLGELQDTGLPDWTDGYDLSDYLDEHPELGYDAIILDEGGDLVDGKPV